MSTPNNMLNLVADQSRTLLYVMSPSYSGSTLLTRLLAAHPDISTVGELKASVVETPESYRCSCGELFLKCEFWNSLVTELGKAGHSLNLRDWNTRFGGHGLAGRAMRASVQSKFLENIRSLLLALPLLRPTFDSVLEANELIINAICELQGGKVFLDDSKDPSRLMHFFYSNRWNIKVLSLTRDGRGTANSDMKHNEIPFREAVHSWRHKLKEMERVEQMIPASMLMRIKYESLCERTDETLKSIAKFCEIDEDCSWASTEPVHILGNEMRLRNLDEIRLDEKWKSNLTEVQLSEFDQIAGKINIELGYRE